MPEKNFKGIPASDGIAIGPAFCYIPAELAVPVCAAGTVEEEMSRFAAARERARLASGNHCPEGGHGARQAGTR